MLRRYIASFLIASILAVLSLHADDFWIKKDWKHWSKDDCEKLLGESPWAHSWSGGPDIDLQKHYEGIAVVYCVQLRSALPIREAMVRKLQFDKKYDKMTADQKTSFDIKAAQVLQQIFNDMILVHVDYSKSEASGQLELYFSEFIQTGIDNLNAFLISEDGTKIKLSRFDKKVYGTFDLVFPRLKSGVPIIHDGQKQFSVQFQSPLVTLGLNPPVESRLVRVEFDLEKMSFGGKLSY